ncbi:hypothetical protein FACS189413_17430 [Bacteroidia bacterium]|nr:hypothetical protein FACS189413_17430 [Bacteroidia bacterium]
MERYFIDTNILIQIITEQDFTEDVRYILHYSGAQIYISSECIKEFIHLIQHEKIKPSKKSNITSLDIFELIRELNYEVKFVDAGHLKRLTKLEPVEGHTDPSDRLIIAQAIAENMPLISSDRYFPKYKKQGLDFIPNY